MSRDEDRIKLVSLNKPDYATFFFIRSPVYRICEPPNFYNGHKRLKLYISARQAILLQDEALLLQSPGSLAFCSVESVQLLSQILLAVIRNPNRHASDEAVNRRELSTDPFFPHSFSRLKEMIYTKM